MESGNSKQCARPLIAVVDDDELVCRAIARLALSRGIRAQTFTRGRALIELLDSEPCFQPLCVVLDLHMPDLDGLAVQKHLALSRPGAHVIFLSARMEENERERALAAGALAVFRKPLCDDLEAFFEGIMSTLGR